MRRKNWILDNVEHQERANERVRKAWDLLGKRITDSEAVNKNLLAFLKQPRIPMLWHKDKWPWEKKKAERLSTLSCIGIVVILFLVAFFFIIK